MHARRFRQSSGDGDIVTLNWTFPLYIHGKQINTSLSISIQPCYKSPFTKKKKPHVLRLRTCNDPAGMYAT